MTPASTETQENERGQRARKLLLLLVASSLVLASLLCCGQVALLLATSSRTVDTLSLLRADYSPWGFEKVGVINASGYIKDLQNDQEQEGVVVVVPGDVIEPGVFWPTGIPTPMPVAAVTETESLTPTAFIPTLTTTLTAAPSATPTPTISGGMPVGTATGTPTRTPTYTATSTRPAPVATLSPTLSPTRTFTYVPQPTRTHTQGPVDPSDTPVPPTRTFTPTRANTLPVATATRTPTRTHTLPVYTPTRAPTRANTVTIAPATRTPTRTNTALPPTQTFTPTKSVPTFTPTHTPVAPSPTVLVPPTFTFTPTVVVTTPAPVPVLPISENHDDGQPNGRSDPDPGNPNGCMGYFGYLNGNAGEVDIPLGSSNSLSAPAYYVYTGEPYFHDGLPSHFYTGRYTGIVQVKWESGTAITWTINGQSATVNWCH